jgi:ribosome biogenesis GTPase / thiamine phosphate phosphatase
VIADALVPYGWSDRVRDLLAGHADELVPGRVVRVERIAVRVITATGDDVLARAAELPAVGDWVLVDTDDPPSVRAVADRWSTLTRITPHGDRLQVLAANVDVVLLTCPADRPSVPRVEREAVVAWESGARPVVVVTKADVGAADLVAELTERIAGVEVIETAAKTGQGLDRVAALMAPGLTGVVLGPSGAGKSTLINGLLGTDRFDTGPVREGDARGRHTTTTREMVTLPGGGTIIDTPGLRSIGVSDEHREGVEAAFSDVVELAAGCRFNDCAHETEPDCAVRAALADGRLDPARFESWRKLVLATEAGEHQTPRSRRR